MYNRLLAAVIFCICFLSFSAKAAAQIVNVNDETYLLLALKKANAKYEQVRSKFERAEKMLDGNLISQQEFEIIKQQYLVEETNYQQALLRVIFEQPHILIEKAVKYQTQDKQKRVKLTLRNTTGGALEYQKLMLSDSQMFTNELEPDKINNLFISIMNIDDQTIIGQPYEIKIPELKFRKARTVDFLLLREEVEAIKVSMTYANKTVQKNIYLQKDASANIVAINSAQFSLEADLGGQAAYDLTLERFSSEDDIYKLQVVNLPRLISYNFTDTETGARLSQVKFTQGVTSKKLSLVVYLPDRYDDEIVIDQPIEFYVTVLSSEEILRMADLYKNNGVSELEKNSGGKVRLELIPRGVGRIEVRAPSLYHEIKTGDTLAMNITVKNSGTRRLDNVKISTDNPLNWRSIVQPDLIRSLEVAKEADVHLTFLPPADVGVGAHEIRIKTEALAYNRPVETQDKTMRIQVQARTSILGTGLLMVLLIGIVVGVVVFGIRISRR